MKKLLISLLSLTLVSSTSLFCVSSSKVAIKIQEDKRQALDEVLEKNAIKISKTDKLKYNLNIDQYEKKFLKKRIFSTKSTLEEKANNYIKLFDIQNSFGTQRIYVYDKDNIESEIYSFVDNELNEQESIKYDFDEEMKFINSYSHINSLHYDYGFQNAMSNLYLKKIADSNDEEKQYLSNYAWSKYEKPVEQESKPDFFSQTINGFSQVYSFVNDVLLIGLDLAISAALSFLFVNPLTTTLLPAIIPLASTALTKIGFPVSEKIVKKIVKGIVKKAVKTPLKKDVNGLWIIQAIKQFIKNQNLKPILEKNREFLSDKYGQDVWTDYNNFFMEGFDNGIAGKINSTFGGVSVKDRAVLIFDKIRNPLWNLDSITSHSTAKFREWLPWSTYTNKKTMHHSVDQNKILEFFTATLATKTTWTGTYYGPVNKSREKWYDLDWSANFLEKTTLELKPNISKKSKTIAKLSFINENLKDTRGIAKFFKDNKNEFDNEMEQNTKDILSNYPTNSIRNNYKFLSFGKIFK
ncbi:hypothetical protein [Williamsoniiplasma lucivorax]|uniref:Lipoprotein n=1 Tax=Williamsoniiplasma lucivorax TaxID=209274 RepID=A0A2S5RFR8_9MOLU|nr:hypothetical protein [Williamsoniiplasma lucivorax]PPE06174.1 hypothetical protein ELUCI_v1c04650 [Williamsoniiplasma lucivorax]